MENQDDAITISAASICIHWRAGGSRGVGREHCADAALPALDDRRGVGMLAPELFAQTATQNTDQESPTKNSASQ